MKVLAVVLGISVISSHCHFEPTGDRSRTDISKSNSIQVEGEWEVISRSVIEIDKVDFSGNRLRQVRTVLRSVPQRTCDIWTLEGYPTNPYSGAVEGDASVGVGSGCTGKYWTHQLLQNDGTRWLTAASRSTYTAVGTSHTDELLANCVQGTQALYSNENVTFDQLETGYVGCAKF